MFLGLLISAYLLFRYLAGPISVSLTSLPLNYPENLPLFNIKDANSIQHIQGKGRGKMFQILTSPFELTIKSVSTTAAYDFKKNIDEFTSKLTDNDSVIVKWTKMKNSKTEVLKYYSDLFKKNEMKETILKDQATESEYLSASGKKAAIQVYVNDTSASEGIDELIVTVDYLAK